MNLKRYEDLPISSILDKWKKSTNPVGVYIHSPFCPSICKFCIYAGTLQKNKNEYDDYYGKYLPEVIDLYSSTLDDKKNSIRSWFFGGGTPSLMTAKTIKDVLDRLPNFKESQGFKIFEIHPAYWDTEQLDVLKEYNFDAAIICLQTFDRNTLIKQKRVPAELDKIKDLSDELKKRGILVFLDVIAFLNDSENDVNILKNDLEKSYEFIFPDEISVQTLYQKKSWTEHTIKTVFDSSFVTKNEYLIEEITENEFCKFIEPSKFSSEQLKIQFDSKCFRMCRKNIKNSDRVFAFINHLDPQWDNLSDNDTLAIGSYKNKSTQTHSNISNFNYIEYNQTNEEPKFKFVKSSFFDEARKILDLLEKHGEPPKEFELKLKNKMFSRNEIPLSLEWSFTNHTKSIDIQKDIDDYCEVVYKKIKES